MGDPVPSCRARGYFLALLQLGVSEGRGRRLQLRGAGLQHFSPGTQQLDSGGPDEMLLCP